jgi:S1-C subfamily serine protease
MRRAFALLGFLLLAGCSLQAEEPPTAKPEVTIPELVNVSPAVSQAERVHIPDLARDSVARRARRMTVRFRITTCEGLFSGSGFALGDDLLVTNRHVLAGAETLEVSTWNGRTVHVSSARVGVLGDVGLVRVEGKLQQATKFGRPPQQDDVVTAVGYPRGGPLTFSRGTVVDRVDGGNLGVPGMVVRLTARLRPGNSGGPLLDRRGHIVGIVYGEEIDTGFGLAIPVDTFRRLARIGGYESVPACGEE